MAAALTESIIRRDNQTAEAVLASLQHLPILQQRSSLEACAMMNVGTRRLFVTPLQAATFLGDPEVVQRLLAAGCDPNNIGKMNQTPLQIAVSQQQLNYNVVGLLLPKSSMNTRNSDGKTVLHVCSHDEVVSMLVSSGADVNALDSFNNTPLHCAAVKNLPQMCRVLIEHGADSALRNRSGQTWFDSARQGGMSNGNVGMIGNIIKQKQHQKSTQPVAAQYPSSSSSSSTPFPQQATQPFWPSSSSSAPASPHTSTNPFQGGSAKKGLDSPKSKTLKSKFQSLFSMSSSPRSSQHQNHGEPSDTDDEPPTRKKPQTARNEFDFEQRMKKLLKSVTDELETWHKAHAATVQVAKEINAYGSLTMETLLEASESVDNLMLRMIEHKLDRKKAAKRLQRRKFDLEEAMTDAARDTSSTQSLGILQNALSKVDGALKQHEMKLIQFVTGQAKQVMKSQPQRAPEPVRVEKFHDAVQEVSQAPQKPPSSSQMSSSASTHAQPKPVMKTPPPKRALMMSSGPIKRSRDVPHTTQQPQQPQQPQHPLQHQPKQSIPKPIGMSGQKKHSFSEQTQGTNHVEKKSSQKQDTAKMKIDSQTKPSSTPSKPPSSSSSSSSSSKSRAAGNSSSSSSSSVKPTEGNIATRTGTMTSQPAAPPRHIKSPHRINGKPSSKPKSSSEIKAKPAIPESRQQKNQPLTKATSESSKPERPQYLAIPTWDNSSSDVKDDDDDGELHLPDMDESDDEPSKADASCIIS